MSQHLPDPNRPLTVSILRSTLEALEAAGHADTPISQYTGAETHRLLQAHNITADTSVADRTHSPALGLCSTWDITRQGSTITSFVIL